MKGFKGGQIGLPMGPESHLRMPLADFERLKTNVPNLVHDNGIIRDLRMIKSTAEIAKISQACTIAGRAFARISEILQVGTPFDLLFRQFWAKGLWRCHLASLASAAQKG